MINKYVIYPALFFSFNEELRFTIASIYLFVEDYICFVWSDYSAMTWAPQCIRFVIWMTSGLWFEWRHIAWLDRFFYINSEHVPLPTQRGFKLILWQNKCDEFFSLVNTLRPRQNGRHFTDDIFKCIFLNENAWISLQISLKFVPKVQINNIPALVQIMAWRRPGDKPLSEPMMVSLLTNICVTRPQWVKIPVVQFSMVLNTILIDTVHFVMWFLFI